MINPNELRLGNLVKDRGEKTIKIDFIEYVRNGYDTKFGQLMYLEGEEVHPMTEYSDYAFAIPITEEWLLKFGFVSNPYQDRYELDNIYFQGCKLCFECDKTKGFTELWIEQYPTIKYVHQLQNLYFAITGDELVQNGI